MECPVCKVEDGEVYLYGESVFNVRPTINTTIVNDRFTNRYGHMVTTFYNASYRDDALRGLVDAIMSFLSSLGYSGMRMNYEGTRCLTGELYEGSFEDITILGDGGLLEELSEE